MISAIFMAVFPGSSAYNTEFYILGQDNTGDNYPQKLIQNETSHITVGIINNNRATQSYIIKVYNRDKLVGSISPLGIKPGEKWEKPVAITPIYVSKDSIIEIFLYEESASENLVAELRLWVEVVSD